MKTTKEDWDVLRMSLTLLEESKIGVFAEHKSRTNRILSDLSRLAEIEAARGGLTEEQRGRCRSIQLIHKPDSIWGTALRLDDALSAANEELARVRGMLLDYDLHLGNAMAWVDHFRDEPADVQRRIVTEFRAKARAYLAEVEGRDE